MFLAAMNGGKEQGFQPCLWICDRSEIPTLHHPSSPRNIRSQPPGCQHLNASHPAPHGGLLTLTHNSRLCPR